LTPHSPPSGAPVPVGDARLRDAARDLEATFIAEMLRASGAARDAGPGASGEESPFASFLLDARAREIARAGGFGLAEMLFESLAGRDGSA
jgi:Rod binding domain-containing protein